MLKDTIKDRIFALVDAQFDEQLETTAKLVNIPSTRAAEAPAQDLMADLMRSRGYEVDDWTINIDDLKELPDFGKVETDFTRARTVVGTLRPDNATGKSLILQGHCDVVPAGPRDMWHTDPYQAVIKDGWMHGRGAADMKGGTLAAFYAVDAIRKAGFKLCGRLHFQSVIEEESTGVGALSTLQRGYRADCALLPEPTGQRMSDVCLGVIWFRIKVRGEPTHVAVAGEGFNAIKAATKMMTALESLEAEWNKRAKSDPIYGSMEHPINFNPGIIHGGDWASSVPAWCDLDCRIAIMPGWSVEESCREIEACIANAAKSYSYLANNPPQIEYCGFHSHGYVMRDAPDVHATMAAAHQASTNIPYERRAPTAINDARFYDLYYDMPAFCYGPRGEVIHGFNERLNLNSLKETTKAIAYFVAAWCGVEEA